MYIPGKRGELHHQHHLRRRDLDRLNRNRTHRAANMAAVSTHHHHPYMNVKWPMAMLESA